ncbi:MAG: pyridoxine 5'-phosphate synthase, partial [candidate division Zixibacteria bacterium]|nr:pyridoxine 5'-phosphate synthase [candidate division Zixibacteria bacterium]
MALLSVNLDMIAALREMRHIGVPDPSQITVLAEIAGVDGIAVQLHRDRRYIRERDLYLLKGIIKTKLTIEIPPVEEIFEKILEIKPWMVTIVA